MTGSSPSSDENFPFVTPLYSPLKLRGDEGGLRGRGEVLLCNLRIFDIVGKKTI
jgi:hypothetical protein